MNRWSTVVSAALLALAAMDAGCGNPPREQATPPAIHEPVVPPPPPLVKAEPIVTPIVVPFQPTSFGVAVSGHGRPIIFLPGIGCPGSVWDDTVAHFGGSIEAHVVSFEIGRAHV